MFIMAVNSFGPSYSGSMCAWGAYGPGSIPGGPIVWVLADLPAEALAKAGLV